MNQKGLRVSQVADVLQCSAETVRRLSRRGVLKGRRNFLGHRIFELEEILKIKAQREQLHD